MSKVEGQLIPFKLDPRLAKDCIEITDLDLSRILLMNDIRYPWILLVPRRKSIREIHHLTPEDQKYLFIEITKSAEFLEREFQPSKINIGAIGNIVPQLHIHIIARNINDPAWPNPVWGHSPPVNYDKDNANKILEKIVNNFMQ